MGDAVIFRPTGAPPKEDHILTNGTIESKGKDGGKHSSVPDVVPSPPGTNVDQIVTFSSRAVDNMSDVMDILNIRQVYVI